MPIHAIDGGTSGSGGSSGFSTDPAELHDATHNPVALWQLNGDSVDSSGNGFDLTISGGQTNFGPAAVPGELCAFLPGNQHYNAPRVADLQIDGDITVELLFHTWVFDIASTYFLIACMATGTSDPDDNHLYSIGLSGASGPPQRPRIFLEEGAGNNLAWITRDGHLPGRWNHIAYVREGAVHRVYLNGGLLEENDSLGLPEKGADPQQRVRIGGRPSGNDYVGMISSVKIVAGVLSANQILAEAQRTLPPDLRPTS